MKHIISLFVASFMMVFFCSYQSFALDSCKGKNKKKIILTHQNKKYFNDNKSYFTSSEATYDPDMDIIELSCYEMKETSIYILDQAGRTLVYDSFDSDASPFFVIDAPSKAGTYTIVIDSPVYYAEGVFTVE